MALRLPPALGPCAGLVALAIGLVVTGEAGAQQGQVARPFGPGRCGPVDASYVRAANATGGQVLPLGPSEVGAAAPLMAASFGTEPVFWGTAALSTNGYTITVPVDGVTSRVAFIASTVGNLTGMAVTDPKGASVALGAAGVETSTFACVRAVTVERPVNGAWTIRLTGSGTFWLVVHAASALALDEARFVRAGGRPGHEGLFTIPGQPIAGRPATLRARISRKDVTDATFDLVSMSGASLQSADLEPVTTDRGEDEFVGAIPRLPTVPFRVRVSGRDRTGASYQRVSRAALYAATVEVIAPEAVSLQPGTRTPVRVNIRNVGAPARFQIVAVVNATIMRVDPATIEVGTNEEREVTILVEVPAGATRPDEEIIVTADSGRDPSASNSTILRATIDAAR